MKKIIHSVLLPAVVFAFASAGLAQEQQPQPAPADKVKPYPLDTCIVTGEKFGAGGMKTYTFRYQNQEIKLCCKPCEKDFRKEPAKYMAKIKEAADKGGKTKNPTKE